MKMKMAVSVLKKEKEILQEQLDENKDSNATIQGLKAKNKTLEKQVAEYKIKFKEQNEFVAKLVKNHSVNKTFSTGKMVVDGHIGTFCIQDKLNQTDFHKSRDTMKEKIRSLEDMVTQYKQQQIDDHKAFEQLEEKMYQLNSLHLQQKKKPKHMVNMCVGTSSNVEVNEAGLVQQLQFKCSNLEIALQNSSEQYDHIMGN